MKETFLKRTGIFTLVFLLCAFVLPEYLHAQQAPPPAEEEKSDPQDAIKGAIYLVVIIGGVVGYYMLKKTLKRKRFVRKDLERRFRIGLDQQNKGDFEKAISTFENLKNNLSSKKVKKLTFGILELLKKYFASN